MSFTTTKNKLHLGYITVTWENRYFLILFTKVGIILSIHLDHIRYQQLNWGARRVWRYQRGNHQMTCSLSVWFTLREHVIWWLPLWYLTLREHVIWWLPLWYHTLRERHWWLTLWYHTLREHVIWWLPLNVIFVLDLIYIDGLLCCLISISCREQVQQY
jgi:hypothetical protein